MIKKILLVLLFGLIVIQFIHPKKNISPGPQPNYIGNVHPIPQNVKDILVKACNDCHSNNTRYPWYTKLQPVHWWLNHHIKEGKEHWNFDEYSNRNLRYQYHKLEELEEQVEENHMPLDSYTWTHKDAILTPDEKSALISWSVNARKSMESKYPVDSLKRKK